MVAITEAFAVLPAHDVARARAWYAEKLGVEPVLEMDGSCVYQFGTSRLFLYASPNAGSATSTAAGLTVADLDATMSELRERGVTFEDYDLPGGPKTTDGVMVDEQGGKSAWFTDSEGNVLNVVQLPKGLFGD